MADVQITCITRAGGTGYEHITQAGSVTGQWKWTVAAIVESIDAGSNTFFVLDPNTRKRADVGVVRPTGGRPYIRTYADGVWTDNLLSLPSCP